MAIDPIRARAHAAPDERTLTERAVARKRRRTELGLLLAAAAIVAVLLWRVAAAQSDSLTVRGQPLPAALVEDALEGDPTLPDLLHLNRPFDEATLASFLSRAVPDSADRAAVARAAADDIGFGAERRALASVGALTTLSPDSATVASFLVQPPEALDPSRSARVARDTSRDGARFAPNRLAVRVTNLEGDGLQGISVNGPTPPGQRTPRTDTGGRVSFDGLAPGAWHAVRPSLAGYVFEPLGMPADSSGRLDSLLVQSGAAVTFVGRPYPTAQVLYRFSRVKSSFIVRTPAEFRSALVWQALWFFLAFAAVHLVWRYAPTWRARGPRIGDPYLLPLVLLLSGLGLVLMVAVRDPFRDEILFGPFVQGVWIAAAALALAGIVDAAALLRPRPARLPLLGLPLPRWLFLLAPFALATTLFVLLALYGDAPAGAEARINLWGIQPSEPIKLLVVIGLAGILARYHTQLRELGRRHIDIRGRRIHIWRLGLPRLQDALAFVLIVGLTLLAFFRQDDNGPALILAGTALGLYGVARRSIGWPLAGFGALAGVFWLAYRFLGGTVRTRIDMMLSPWDNYLANGVQLAEAHWALATGGVWGVGLGRGAPSLIPAAHTDMVLAGLGEEIGLLGLLVVLTLFAALIWRGLRASLAATSPFAFFLGVGLSLLLAFQLLLIAGGILGLLPLSGVVTPFLSFGKSSMGTNGLLVGLLASISAAGTLPHLNDQTAPYRAPVRVLGLALALVGAVFAGRLVQLQALDADDIAVRPALVRLNDESRAFDYNQRIFHAIRDIPRGTITDRDGLVLASSDCSEIRAQRDRLEAAPFRVDVESLCAEDRDRYYPLGAHTFYLLGDRETRLYQADDSRTSALTFVEFDPETNQELQGYDDRHRVVRVRQSRDRPDVRDRDLRDFQEILPLMRSRGPRRSRAARALLDRDRDVRLSLDARLQVEVAAELAEALTPGRANQPDRPTAAATVIDARTGEVLAAVTLPLPREAIEDPDAVAADSEMRERAISWRMAPASTFKAVVAIAALRQDPDAMALTYPCDDRRSPAEVPMAEALARSCNSYFQRLATDLGRRPLDQMLEAFDIEDPGAARGVPSSLTQIGIGQGGLLATTADMALVAATVANDGVRPEATFRARSGPPSDAVRVLPADLNRRLASALRGVVTNPRGTAHRIDGASLPIAGKTGTGQYRTPSRGRINRSWFIGYGPYGRPSPVAVAVMVDAPGGGGGVAAPPAARILEAAVATDSP